VSLGGYTPTKVTIEMAGTSAISSDQGLANSLLQKNVLDRRSLATREGRPVMDTNTDPSKPVQVNEMTFGTGGKHLYLTIG
jgi:hypothetical protein